MTRRGGKQEKIKEILETLANIKTEKSKERRQIVLQNYKIDGKGREDMIVEIEYQKTKTII